MLSQIKRAGVLRIPANRLLDRAKLPDGSVAYESVDEWLKLLAAEAPRIHWKP